MAVLGKKKLNMFFRQLCERMPEARVRTYESFIGSSLNAAQVSAVPPAHGSTTFPYESANDDTISREQTNKGEGVSERVYGPAHDGAPKKPTKDAVIRINYRIDGVVLQVGRDSSILTYTRPGAPVYEEQATSRHWQERWDGTVRDLSPPLFYRLIAQCGASVRCAPGSRV